MEHEAFAYCFDEEVIRSVLPAWPEDLGLLLCLTSDGGSHALIFHSDEHARVLRRAADLLSLAPRSFPVTPQVKGWPTRTVRFSEEQSLLKLVLAMKDLPEKARAYLTRYRSEQEKAEAAETEAAAETGPRASLSMAKADVLERIRRKRAESAAIHIPAGFQTGGPKLECRFGTGFIGKFETYVRLILGPDAVSIHTTPARVTEVGISSDFRRLFVPRKAIGDWAPGRPAVIDMPIEVFPPALREIFSGGMFHADITVTSDGIYIAPGAAVEIPEEPGPVEVPHPAARPRPRLWRLPIRAAAACLVAGTAVAGVAMVPSGFAGAVPSAAVQQDDARR